MSEWSVAEPRKLTFDEPVTALHVRVVDGTVNVMGTDEGSARLEVSDIEGPPLTVTQKDGTLTVAYDDLPRKGFLTWLDRKVRRRTALVSLAVPTGTRVEVGVLGAAVGVMGTLQATEVLKEIVGIGEGLAGRLLLYDARNARFNEIKVAWDPANPLSGKAPTIRDLSIHAGGGQGAVCAA